MAQIAHEPTRVQGFSRLVFALGVCLTAGTGIGLFLVPDRTADFWAWTIKAPLTAAFFGVGYISAAISLALAARGGLWQRTRVVAVAAFTLTSLALLATLLERGPFAFGEGGLREGVAWIWLAVYVALPPLVLIAFVRQERLGGSDEYDVGGALPAIRILLGCVGLVLGAVGVLLVLDWRPLADNWPWTLPSLPARVLGAWLCTYAVTLLWFALLDHEWVRVRIAVLPALVVVALNAVAAVRFHDDFRGGLATALYLVGLTVLGLSVAGAALVEGRRTPGVAIVPA
jgi:hypothetical protein